VDHLLTIPNAKHSQIIQMLCEGFTYCTAINLNVGFWTIPLDKPLQLTLGKYCYLHLPMGLVCSPDIYQEKMSELFIDMISVIVYQDEILVLWFL
jgi:hypothetical protein